MPVQLLRRKPATTAPSPEIPGTTEPPVYSHDSREMCASRSPARSRSLQLLRLLLPRSPDRRVACLRLPRLLQPDQQDRRCNRD